MRCCKEEWREIHSEDLQSTNEPYAKRSPEVCASTWLSNYWQIQMLLVRFVSISTILWVFTEWYANWFNLISRPSLSCLFCFLFFVATAVVISEEPTALYRLRRGIREVTGEEQHVPGLNLPGESHEDARIQNQSWEREKMWSESQLEIIPWPWTRNCKLAITLKSQLTSRHRSRDDPGIFLDVNQAGNRDSPVRDRSPEMCAAKNRMGSGKLVL